MSLEVQKSQNTNWLGCS